jgi:hypothetical protein
MTGSSKHYRDWCLPAALGLSLVAAPHVARAQDTFEIQVYEYATVPRNRWNLETHFNLTVNGTRDFQGTVSPTNNQRHLTFELTRGITNYFELAGYLVLADRPGRGPEYAGYRVRPRVRAPESWGLPFLFSFSLEVGFPRAAYEENSATLEVRPILEKRFGRVLVDLNPVVGRALRGPGSGDGWDFEPSLRLGYGASKKLDLSAEYYASTGDSGALPVKGPVHLLFPGFDYQFNDDVVLNFGYGFGLTHAGDKGILKMRLGVLFGSAPK